MRWWLFQCFQQRIETALGEEKKTYLIETHSEHLLLRIMRRIRETTNGDRKDKIQITPEDVQILFVKPSRKGEDSIIKKIALDEEGELIDRWPGGFFEEGFEEAMEMAELMVPEE